MTTSDDQQLTRADTLGGLRQTLLELGKAALAKHPVLNAMATQIRATDAGTVLFTFDGPALPVKQNCEVLLPPDPEFHRHALEAFMHVCEESVASAMRHAGYAIGHGGDPVPLTTSGATEIHGVAACGPVRVSESHGVAQGGGSGSACESEPSFHGSGPVD